MEVLREQNPCHCCTVHISGQCRHGCSPSPQGNKPLNEELKDRYMEGPPGRGSNLSGGLVREGWPLQRPEGPCCPRVPSSRVTDPRTGQQPRARPTLRITNTRMRSLGDYVFKAQIVSLVCLPAFIGPSVIPHTDNISYVH